MKHQVWLLTIPLLLEWGCSRSNDSQVATTPPPPPPLTAELRDTALERGKVIAKETFSLLSSNLQAAIQQGGVSNALPFCSLVASPLTASMASKHGVTLRRVTHKPRNPAGRADAAELAVLKQFQIALAAAGSSNPPPPLVTDWVEGTATFFAPIVLNNELCLKCHGEPGKDISAEDIAVIQRLYPQDEATGLKLGELRGAWRIDFPLANLLAKP